MSASFYKWPSQTPKKLEWLLAISSKSSHGNRHGEIYREAIWDSQRIHFGFHYKSNQ